MSKKKDKKIKSADGTKGIASKTIKDKKKKKSKLSPSVSVNMLDTSGPRSMSGLSPSRSSMLGAMLDNWVCVSAPSFVKEGYTGPQPTGALNHPGDDSVSCMALLGLEDRREIEARLEAEFKAFYATQYSDAKLRFILMSISNRIDNNLLLDFKYNKPKAISKVRAMVNSIGDLND